MQADSSQQGHSNYLDFEMEIGQGSGREYPVTVLRSPAGEARATMHFPFDELALDLRLGKLQIALLRSGGKHRRAPSEEERAVQDFGQALFDALLSGEIRSCYDVSLREAIQQDKGLRLKLRMHPPELSALPWEFMYDPRQADYVCLSRQTPIVRYLESHRLIQPLKVSPPLRILGMVASPKDLPALDVEREKERMERAVDTLRDHGLVELVWLQGQTWRDLQEATWAGPWHVFHFIGHGGFDPHADEGFIALSNGEGWTNPLSATLLGRLLADHTSLRLVVLNSCEGAKGSDRDLFSSTASILVRRGVPAVVAMQYEITDRAAVELARAFYRALAHGMAVDEALVVARKAISLGVTNTVEWGTPVLYTRAPDGVLFELSEPRDVAPLPLPPKEPEAPPEIDAEQEQRLKQLYLEGLDAIRVKDWDRAVHNLRSVIAAQPDYQDAAAKLHEAELLLARAEEELDQERQRQERIVALYGEAQGLARAGQWQQALAQVNEIHTLDPQFADPMGIAAKASRETTRREEEARRQSEAAALYAEAVRLVQAGQYQAALDMWNQARARYPQYPDRDRVETTARQRLATPIRAAPVKREQSRRKARPVQPRRSPLPTWFWLMVGGAAALLVIVVGLIVLALGSPDVATLAPSGIFVDVSQTTSIWTPTPRLPTATNLPMATLNATATDSAGLGDKSTPVATPSSITTATSSELPAPTETGFESYRITITTGNVWLAGTDANVFITLFGQGDLNTGEMRLDNPGNEFEMGNVDTFVVETRNVGDIDHLRIRHDNSGVGAGWYVEKIRVMNEAQGKSWIFPIGRWLATDEGDQKIDLIVYPQQ